ncbi:hypothetical protein [Azospirillum melinis]
MDGSGRPVLGHICVGPRVWPQDGVPVQSAPVENLRPVFSFELLLRTVGPSARPAR